MRIWGDYSIAADSVAVFPASYINFMAKRNLRKCLLPLVILTAQISAFAQLSSVQPNMIPATPPIEPGVSLELARWRAARYSDVRYKLNLTLEKMSPVLRGSMEIHVTQAAYACAEPDCPPMAIILDWRKIKGHEKDSTISNVTLNGAALSVTPLLTRGLLQCAFAHRAE